MGGAWFGALAGFVAGAALQLQERALLPMAAYGAAVVAVVLAAALWLAARALKQQTAVVTVLALLAGIALGGGASGWRASHRLADALDPALEGRDLVVTGVVASLPQLGEAGLRFRFAVDNATRDGQPVRVPALLSLGWYRGVHDGATAAGPDRLSAGDRWRLTVRLKRPHGSVNPHGFDYELWLFEQGIRATGYVRPAQGGGTPERLERAAGYPIERLRQHVRDAIAERVSDPRAAGVLAALVVGDQAAIEREDWDVFRATGVAHLMSISGLHVTMFAWLAGTLIATGWRRSGRLALALPAPSAARWGGLTAACAYAAFAGWGVPAQRTVWMLAAITLLGAAGKRWPWGLVLLAAAALVVALDPWALLQPGFWLSFVAVALLFASDPGADRGTEAPPALPEPHQPSRARQLLATVRRALSEGLRTQAIATISLAPLTLIFFQQVSLVGFVANLAAIPLVTLVITPLAMLGMLWSLWWGVAAWATDALTSWLTWLARWPGATWTTAAAPDWAIAAGLLGGVLAVLPLPWRVRWLALPLLLPLLAPPVPRPAHGDFELIAADVGQGTAVIVRTAQHTWLYDAGPRYSRDADAGQRVLLPLLRALGERELDALILSHRDTDHVGGALAVQREYPPARLWSSLEPEHELLASMPPGQRIRCEAGQRLQRDGVQLEMLHPQPADYARELKPNALSCVLKITGRNGSALLTGDIERTQELELTRAAAQALRADLVLVPHHGSKTSSTEVFLDAVQAQVAVVQAGYRNRFGHPAPEVLGRYHARGIRVVETPSCGAYRWPGRGAPASEVGSGLCSRAQDRRYWRSQGR